MTADTVVIDAAWWGAEAVRCHDAGYADLEAVCREHEAGADRERVLDWEGPTVELLDGLISTLHAQEEADVWHLERAAIEDEADAINWLLNYVRDESGAIWVETGVTERRRIAKALRRVRDRFNNEWKARGGRDGR